MMGHGGRSLGLVVSGLVLIAAGGCGSAKLAWRSFFDGRPERSASHRTGPHQPGHTVIVVDIDHTICHTDYFDLILQTSRERSRPLPGSRDTLVGLAKRFEIIYLTSRPTYLHDSTLAWLREHAYPEAPLFTADRISELVSQRRYKTRSLGDLLNQHPNAYIGIGDRDSDASAYRAHQMLAVIVNPDDDSSFHSRDIVLRNWSDVDAFFRVNAAVLEDPAQVRLAAQKGLAALQMPAEVKPVRFDEVDDGHGRGKLNRALVQIFPKFKSNARKQAAAAQALANNLDLRTAMETAAEKWPHDTIVGLGLGMAGDVPVMDVTLVQENRLVHVVLDAASGDQLQTRTRRIHSAMLKKLSKDPHAYIPLQAAMEVAVKKVDAQPYRVELLSEYSRPTYEVSLLGRKGFWEVDVDAATGLLQEVDHRWRLIPLE